MKADTFGAQYELIEFNHYIDQNTPETTSVVDLVIKYDDPDSAAKDFNNLFVVETKKTSYVFNNYEVTECYDVGGGLVRLICVR